MKGRGKALVLIVGGLLLIGVVVGVRAKGLLGGKPTEATHTKSRSAESHADTDSDSPDSSSESEGTAHEGGGELAEPKPTIPLEEFVINLADQDEIRFLKMQIELEISDEKNKEPLEKLKPRIRDAVIRVASRKDLNSLITAGGKDRLKKELRREINRVLGADVITRVYFTAFAMQ